MHRQGRHTYLLKLITLNDCDAISFWLLHELRGVQIMHNVYIIYNIIILPLALYNILFPNLLLHDVGPG